MSRFLTPLALAAAMLPIAAGAAPYGGARLVAARVETASPRGFKLYAPDLIAAAGGVRVHGMVCRTTTQAAAPPATIAVERLDSAMRVTGVAKAVPVGMLNERRALGCAVYDVQTGWSLDAGESLRVAAPGA